MGIGAKPINDAMLRLYNSSLPSFDIASDSARLEVGVSTCSNCFAPGSRPGDVVFRALGLTHSILFSIPSSLNDGNRYIGFSDNYNGIWVKILNDRKFRIDGTLIAKEIKIQTDVWSDFVFDPSYALRSLDEVEAFINENRHLPEVPPACQVLEEGIDVAEMNAILLQKVEELTLYLIELEKRMAVLENENTFISKNPEYQEGSKK